MVVPVALQSLPDTPRNEVEIKRPLAVPRRHGGQPVAGLGRRTAARSADRRRRHHRRRRRLGGAIGRLPERRHRRLGQQPEDRQVGRSRAHRQCRRPAMARHHPARRPADFGRCSADELSPRPKAKASEHCSRRARPRPRCAAAACRQAASRQARRRGRPGSSARARRRAHAHAGDALARLADLLGTARHRQDHGGAAPGATRPNFISSRFRRSSPASPISRRCSMRRGCAARPGRARCCSSTRFTASTARSRIPSCR